MPGTPDSRQVLEYEVSKGRIASDDIVACDGLVFLAHVLHYYTTILLYYYMTI